MIQHQLPKLYFFGRLSDTYIAGGFIAPIYIIGPTPDASTMENRRAMVFPVSLAISILISTVATFSLCTKENNSLLNKESLAKKGLEDLTHEIHSLSNNIKLSNDDINTQRRKNIERIKHNHEFIEIGYESKVLKLIEAEHLIMKIQLAYKLLD
jgi:hypothetical protein